tara:strand:- start:552 stop:1502 length:951 start_codon:yes stop_codon:yes gene_type:complete
MFKLIGILPVYTEVTKKKPIINTPILDIRASMKEFDYKALPAFFCYNFDVLTPVRNQGSVCGSCWAFVTAGIISDKISIYKNKPVIMSPQGLIECYDPENACKGAAPEDVFEWMEETNYKLPFEFQLKYKQLRSSKIKDKCPTLPGINVQPGSLHRLTDILPIKAFIQGGTATQEQKDTLSKNILNMKTELVESGPFFATLIVYKDLLTHTPSKPYSSNFLGLPEGGHAIEIVGYCDKGEDPRDGFNAGYWICKNTWGSLWPTKSKTPGYFTVVQGVNMCGIESRCGTINPNITMGKLDDDVAYTNFTKYAAEYIV